MVSIWINVDRNLASQRWAEVEPFARRILEGEKRCCVCGRTDVPVHLTVDGGNLREVGFMVGLLDCSEHTGFYMPKDYKIVNGLLLLSQPSSSEKSGVWFDVPWGEFEKIIASHTSYEAAFIGQGLRNYFTHGIGHLCWKFVEFPQQELLDWYEGWGMHQCPFCQTINPKDSLYCVKCGKKIDASGNAHQQKTN